MVVRGPKCEPLKLGAFTVLRSIFRDLETALERISIQKKTILCRNIKAIVFPTTK